MSYQVRTAEELQVVDFVNSALSEHSIARVLEAEISVSGDLSEMWSHDGPAHETIWHFSGIASDSREVQAIIITKMGAEHPSTIWVTVYDRAEPMDWLIRVHATELGLIFEPASLAS